PATAEQALRVQQDPRYWQQVERNQSRTLPSTMEPDLARPFWPRFGGGGGGGGSQHMTTHADWSEPLGGDGTPGNFPAKYSFLLTTAHCASDANPDFVVYSTGLSGTPTQATIVAYDNLYTGCASGTVPTVYWAYNTGASAKILTSPAFSRDGTQVAFVQDTPTGSSLVLLKWAPSATETISSPDTLVAVAPVLYPTCSAPCMTTIDLRTTLGAATHDTASSVFLDLSNDTAWVGDFLGLLHKFSPVFSAAPAEVTTGGFPDPMPAGSALSSPVHDYLSGNVYVGDASGFLNAVDSTNGTVTQSGQLDFGVGITEGPVVDSTSELVYVFSSADGSFACPGGADCTGVWELSTNFLSGETGAEVFVGNSVIEGTGNPNPVYVGAFDSTYLNSTDATGNLYVCGNTGGSPTIYQVPILAGALVSPIPGPVLSTAAPACSPVTDVYNPNAPGGPSEFFFASAGVAGISAGCKGGGCIYNFNDTPWKANTVYAVGQEVLDSHLHIQVVTTPGMSGLAPPSWTAAPNGVTIDLGVRWRTQGALTSTTPLAWQATHVYTKFTAILDSNGNIELVTTAGMSGTIMPTWPTAAGAITAGDGAVRWTNVGAIATFGLAESNGTSGIIIDNIVGSGTIVGGSQIYFSTLGNNVPCSGGCAVQASQSALQ
ncbi:MAG: hypothetical protein WCA16_03050, partial [Candidatus Sulfotelmatobacter sp.]